MRQQFGHIARPGRLQLPKNDLVSRLAWFDERLFQQLQRVLLGVAGIRRERSLPPVRIGPASGNGDQLFVRERGDDAYRAFEIADAEALLESFRRYGRERFWDL